MSVRHALLALLSEGPKYGLRLRDEFEAGTGEVWPLNIGQVYTTLQRLERDRLIQSDDDAERDSPQKRFRITAEGERELAAWLRTPPDMSSPPRDELVIKVLVAMRVAGTDVREMIQAHRRYLVELMQQWTRIKEPMPTATSRSGWRWTRSCSGWTRWSAGWTPPTGGSNAPRSNRRPEREITCPG